MTAATMTTTTIKYTFIILFLLGLLSPVKAQEQPLKDYAGSRSEHKFCFYPSTLRMINLTHNPDFDDLVRGIDKLLVYNLDSAARADKNYQQLFDTYRDLGFEELASVYGGNFDFFIYGKDRRKEVEYVGIIKQKDNLTAFYLRGNIAFSKIPRLMQSVKNGNVINPFDFHLKDLEKNTHHK